MARRAAKSVADPGDAAGARRAGIKMLKTRLISRAALVMRLTRQGYERPAAEQAAEQLAGAGLLDDRRLAESLVRKQVQAKAAGKTVLVAKLRQRGIDGATAKEAVSEGLKGRDMLADAVDLARRRARGSKPGMDAQTLERKVFGYLARRGFDAEICRAAVAAALGRRGQDDDR
jgi:regulatory protein